MVFYWNIICDNDEKAFQQKLKIEPKTYLSGDERRTKKKYLMSMMMRHYNTDISILKLEPKTHEI